MAYNLSDIITALVAILQAIPGIGTVHAYKRWTNKPEMFKSYFWHESTQLINGCWITRSGYAPILQLSRQKEKRHQMIITQVYSFKDASNTEAPFQALVSAEVDAINNNYTYPGAWHQIAPDGYAQAQEMKELRDFAGFLCNYAEITVTVEVRV